MRALVVISVVVAAALAVEESTYPKAEYKTAAHTKSYDYAPMPHNFAWAVKDEPSYNDFSHQESSDGKVVSGSYRVLLPDGRVQVVTYKADENGYNASIQYEGEAKYDYKPTYNKPAAYPAPASYTKPTYSSTEYTTPAYTTTPYSVPVTYAKPSAYLAEKYPTRPAASSQPSYTTPTYNPAPYKTDSQV